MPEKPASPKNGSRFSAPGSSVAITAVLTYALFASLWILLSDTAVSLLFSDPASITLVSTLKGWFFVLITSLLLYYLIRRLLRGVGAHFSPAASLRPLIPPVVFLATCIVALTWLAINHTITRQQDKETARLQAIADLKTRQIADWMKERLGDARFVQSSRFFAEKYELWRMGGDQNAEAMLLDRLYAFAREKGFESAQLIDDSGETMRSTDGRSTPINPHLKAAALEAIAQNRTLHIGPYVDAAGRIHLDFIAPLLETGTHRRPAAILHADPSEYLFRTLQTWPVPSSSGETVLFRRDGDAVVFINEVRLKTASPLSLRFPISHEKLPASMVLRGSVHLDQPIFGNDYRGVPVIAVARAIEGTDWFLIAKMDQAEIFAESNRDVTWIALAGMLGLFITAAGGVLVRQRQHLIASLRDREVQAEKLQALSLLDAVSNNSTDAIFVKDLQGRYILFNRAAAAFTGTSAEAVIGRDDTALFPPEQAALIMRNDREVMDARQAITFQENLDTPNGQVTFLATKGPLVDNEGAVIGMFGISRDISERKQAEWEREVTVDFLRLINQSGSEEEIIRASVAFFQHQSGCESVGIRLKEGDDYPYYESRGFPPEFIQAESSLCCRDQSGDILCDEAGAPVLACMCGNVIAGRFDPSKPFFTEKGSFWSNNTTELLATTTDADRLAHTRNRCNAEGYESVALIALRVGEEPLGLLQLNDRRRDSFTPGRIALWERLSGYLAVALAKFRAEKLLRTSEETYRSLFDNMLNGFAYCRMLYDDSGNPVDFTYLAVNRAFTELTGLKDVVGRRVSEVIPGIRETDPSLLTAYGRVAATGVPERFEFYLEALQMWFALSVYSPQKDHFVAVFDVITERKRAEDALRESEARLHLALRSANMGVWEWNLQTDEVIWSPECYSLFGVESFGGHLSDFTPMIEPDDLEKVLSAAQVAIDNRKLYIVEFRVRRPDGEMFWVTNFARADYDASGKPTRMVGIVQDISDRKKAEEERNLLQEQFAQAQKMETVGRLAGGVAHDFNNMLAVMFIAIELMRMKLSPADPLQDHLREMDGAATRARDLTRQLLAFSRKQVIAPQVLDLNTLIRNSEKTLSRLIGEDIELRLQTSADLGRVRIDPSQFDQVLMNLVVNARDAMPGGGKVTIETSNASFDEAYCRMHAGFLPGRYVQMAVSDEGVGMSQEVKEHIFEPFFTTKEVGKGTGLGLATIYGIVRQNQGFITVYSEEGFGATFRLFFPRVDEEMSHEEQSPGVVMPGSGTILLVEDDELLCQVTRTTLSQLGYTVTAAHSPAEALQIVEDPNARFDLLLTDIVMPGMNGFELRDRIRQRFPTQKVLFMSGYTSDAILQRGIVEEGIHFIQKPFSIDALSEKLRAILERE